MKAASSLAPAFITAGYSNEGKVAWGVSAVPPARDDGRTWCDGCQLLRLVGWDTQRDTTGQLKLGVELYFNVF